MSRGNNSSFYSLTPESCAHYSENPLSAPNWILQSVPSPNHPFPHIRNRLTHYYPLHLPAHPSLSFPHIHPPNLRCTIRLIRHVINSILPISDFIIILLVFINLILVLKNVFQAKSLSKTALKFLYIFSVICILYSLHFQQEKYCGWIPVWFFLFC